jgi:hypothetical protein
MYIHGLEFPCSNYNLKVVHATTSQKDDIRTVPLCDSSFISPVTVDNLLCIVVEVCLQFGEPPVNLF